MKVKIKLIENGKLPEYKTCGSAGADCYARIKDKIELAPNQHVIIPLGFAVQIPIGYEMQIRPRSGLANKNGITILNSPGTIDSDYRGEVGAIVMNTSNETFEINPEDRIAQAVVCPVIQPTWETVEELDETLRGKGGFGSTGVSEKFYEPFKTIEEVEKFLNKDVVINHNVNAVVMSAKMEKTIVGKQLFICFRTEKGEELKISAITAFNSITLNEHRFGREIKED